MYILTVISFDIDTIIVNIRALKDASWRTSEYISSLNMMAQKTCLRKCHLEFYNILRCHSKSHASKNQSKQIFIYSLSTNIENNHWINLLKFFNYKELQNICFGCKNLKHRHFNLNKMIKVNVHDVCYECFVFCPCGFLFADLKYLNNE